MGSTDGFQDLPAVDEENMKSGLSAIGSRQPSRARTTYMQTRDLPSKLLEQERREIEEIQESMKEMNDFDKKFGSVKSKVGYPRIALKSDLKKF
jgi:hypothetical protein